MLKNGIIWILALVIALVSGLAAVGAIAKNKAPELAVSLEPANGFAFEALASNSLKAFVATNSGQFPNSVDPNALNFAKQAFLSEPVTPEAIAVLALGSTEGKRRKLMLEAFALSRRQQLVTGWMIVDAGTRQNIPAILGHYDTILRTSSSAASFVIPTLAAALANEDFIEPFASLLSKNPSWARRFWGEVVAAPGAIENAADLRKLLHKEGELKENYQDPDLIYALVNNRQFESAESLYQLLADQKKDDSLLKNSSFQHDPKYPPLDWQLFSDGEYGAAITGGNLRLSAIPNSGGLFARQLVKLPPSLLTIFIKSHTGIPDDASVSIHIKCAEMLEKGPRPTKITLSAEVTTMQINNQQSGCSYYWLEVIGRSASNGEGFDVDLDSISLQLK
jgi:hypothetical protein|tara:strand:- start:14306 stop:15484 length:1179 start_codon:yes stop_codon:yes gene_type:complete